MVSCNSQTALCRKPHKKCKNDDRTGSILSARAERADGSDTFPSRPTGACERHNWSEDILGPLTGLTTVVFHHTTTSSAHAYSIMRAELMTNKKSLGRRRGVASRRDGVRTFWHRRGFVVVDLYRGTSQIRTGVYFGRHGFFFARLG